MPDRFAKLADMKLRRKIAPIKKWRELDRITIAKGKTKQTSHYAELKTEEGEMINVWLTDIIRNEH